LIAQENKESPKILSIDYEYKIVEVLEYQDVAATDERKNVSLSDAP
jgi:hypothetical protein